MRYTLACIVALFSTAALAAPPIEAYGELPEIRAFDFSPDGSRYAFFKHQGDSLLMAVFEKGKGNIATVDVSEVKPRAIYFISNNHILVYAGYYTRRYGGYERTRPFTYNIATGKIGPLMNRYSTFFKLYGGAGRSITPTEDPDEVFYASYTGRNGWELLRANLATGKLKVIATSRNASSWLVTKQGVILGRKDRHRKEKYSIHTRRNGEWEQVYEETLGKLESVSLAGYMPDQSGLLVLISKDGQDFQHLKKLSFDGTLSEPLFDTGNRELRNVVVDTTGKLLGVQYAGLKPEYEFLDPDLNRLMHAFALKFPQDDVSLIRWTDDLLKLVLHIAGGQTAPAYYLYDRQTHELEILAPSYLRITDADVAPVKLISYAARDGLNIPSLLTHPKGAAPGSKLPLIVYPHGGPESHDDLGFHYRPQYFANQGYLVLQPNFRGSSGFGAAHRRAGYGEFGNKMQTDVADGVQYLIDAGWADPDRICIIGASYGGYAALFGAVMSPELYKCVVAISAATDLPSLMLRDRNYYGHESRTVKFWLRYYGVEVNDVKAMEEISPSNHAEAFLAPVLLLHGADDVVVPFSQSTKMNNALMRAGKQVRLIKLKGEDHWMSSSKTRLRALQEIDRFVKETIGPAK